MSLPAYLCVLIASVNVNGRDILPWHDFNEDNKYKVLKDCAEIRVYFYLCFLGSAGRAGMNPQQIRGGVLSYKL